MFDSATDCRMLYSGPVQDESVLILLRSKLAAITQRLGIAELKRENILLVASELVSNNIKHTGGRGLIQVWRQPGPVLDILALDYGPGIANLILAEEDGYSTSNTLGKGLGAIRRLSDESFIYTQRKSADTALQKKWSGTIFLARFHLDKRGQDLRNSGIGIFVRSLSDTRYNGDRVYWHNTGGRLRWLHFDALGHGRQAQDVISDLAEHLAHGGRLDEILAAIDRQLARTRGAVGIIGEIDRVAQEIRLLGVGDMHAHLYIREQMRHIPFPPGILGHEHRSTFPFRDEFDRKCVAVTASDGIRRSWDANSFPGLFNQHPQLIAYTLGNIMGRISDDQSVYVARLG
jgi:anti-sigma regulatory factor (Ser/Thr protein kinase)